MKKLVSLRLSAAVVLAGSIYRAGSEVEVEKAVADNLVGRGKATRTGPVEAEGGPSADDLVKIAQEAAQAALEARAQKDQELTPEAWAALSDAKRKACLKAAASAIADEAKATA